MKNKLHGSYNKKPILNPKMLNPDSGSMALLITHLTTRTMQRLAEFQKFDFLVLSKKYVDGLNLKLVFIRFICKFESLPNFGLT